MKKNIADPKLIAYSAAAGAVLAIVPNAFGTIIHQTVDIPFGDGQGGVKNLTMEGLNPDFIFDNNNNIAFSCFQIQGLIKGNSSFIKALSTGTYVGPATNIPNSTYGYFYYNYNQQGDWKANNDTKYFGVSFDKEAGGKVYGWIQVVRLSSGSGKVIAWGYEDDGTKINVGALPEPITGLALLALGAAGIARYRQKV